MDAARHITLLYFSCCLLAIAGCGDASHEATEQEYLRRLAGLPGLQNSNDPALAELLEELEADDATPVLLSDHPPLEEIKTPAQEVLEQFSEQETQEILTLLESLLPPAGFSLAPSRRDQAGRLIARYELQLDRITQLLEHRPWDFPLDFRLGFALDRKFIDVCHVAASLFGIRAEQHMRRGRLPEAVADFTRGLEVTAQLAKEPHVESRLQAAALRRRLLSAIRLLVADRNVTRIEVEVLAAKLIEQLREWPPDEAAWVGDRAQILLGFEIVRAGGLQSLLTAEEVRQFESEGILASLVQLSPETIDRDQRYYLAAMQRIIGGCQIPFHSRQRILAEIKQDLHARRSDEDFPILSARLFLTGMESGHRQQAADRARTESHALALALAVGKADPPWKVNPVSGTPYQVETDSRRIVVYSGLPDEEPIVVPRLDTGDAAGLEP